jgi:nicotinate-nucleotide pyrophosphorylase (carboxylating)
MVIFKPRWGYKICEMLDRLLELVAEDLGRGDITTEAVLRETITVEGRVSANAPGVVAGLEECKRLLEHFHLRCETLLADGEEVNPGDTVMMVQGDAARILSLERVVLNVMMRMSGIATETRRLSKVCRKYNVILAGTRKTTPGFRYFEKKAIAVGGGYPHRLDLGSAFLIKDNHIALIGLEKAVARAREKAGDVDIEVEVTSLEEALAACRAGASVVMLDNLSPEEAGDILEGLKRHGVRDRVRIEISGGVTPENLEEYASLRPDYISMGHITTGVKWLDMSMNVQKI